MRFQRWLFRKDIEPYCIYCARGKQVSRDKAVCIRKGVVALYGHCGGFTYDPLKRLPDKPRFFPVRAGSEKDFEL